MRLSRANIPLASEDRTHGQAKSPSSHYNLAPHFWPGFINLQHFCHSRWRNPVRLSKSGLTGVLRSHLPQVVSERRCLMIDGRATIHGSAVVYRGALYPLSDDCITIDHVLGA